MIFNMMQNDDGTGPFKRRRGVPLTSSPWPQGKACSTPGANTKNFSGKPVFPKSKGIVLTHDHGVIME
jgi:hypothetical protein